MTVIAHEKGISLTLSNQVEAEFWQGDATRIRQVVINIVSNAIKFTKKGSVVIEVKQTNNGNEILFDIEDTGIGMSQEHLSRLYERFEQADQKTSREFGGTGLGMAITRSLVNLLGGRIEVVSQLHKGSTFSVYLPLEMADSPSGISATDTFTDLNLHNKKILIAEDNQLNRIIVKEMLSSKDATIEFAENGLLAINKYKEFQPDLVLMDIQMPEMDGIEACKRIKADNPGLSIVALTANIMAEDIEKYDKAGFDDVLGKPIKQELLLKKLATYLCAD